MSWTAFGVVGGWSSRRSGSSSSIQRSLRIDAQRISKAPEPAGRGNLQEESSVLPCILQVVAPKKESLAEAESSYNAMMEKLNAKRSDLRREPLGSGFCGS